MSEPVGQARVLLDAEALDVRFGVFRAVKKVSLRLHAGDLLGLIGPNGAGKTTLLRALCGLQPTVAGRLTVMGEDATVGAVGVPREKRETHEQGEQHEQRESLGEGRGGRAHLRWIGFTPDTPAVYETMTVRDFLHYAALGYGMHPSLVQERIDFWLEKVWLADKRTQRIKGLSRGMRQRLGIARTLLPDPAVVLLDEPAAGLDPAGRVQFRELLVDLRNQGKCLIVSSHILADMNEYCTHIGIMSAGSMVRFGTVQEVASHGDDGRCGIGLLLAPALEGKAGRGRESVESAGGVAAFLAGLPGVEKVTVNGERVGLEYFSDLGQRAELLARLMEEGYRVAEFTVDSGGLERAYLRTGVAQVD